MVIKLLTVDTENRYISEKGKTVYQEHGHFHKMTIKYVVERCVHSRITAIIYICMGCSQETLNKHKRLYIRYVFCSLATGTTRAPIVACPALKSEINLREYKSQSS